MSHTQFLTRNTKITKNKCCTHFLVNFCEVENIWKVSEGEKPVVTHSRFLHSDVLEWARCKKNPNENIQPYVHSVPLNRVETTELAVQLKYLPVTFVFHIVGSQIC